MTIDKIIEYILHTPYNTNRKILEQMLKELIVDHGGTLDEDPDIPVVPDEPDEPGTSDEVIWDGGVEA